MATALVPPQRVYRAETVVQVVMQVPMATAVMVATAAKAQLGLMELMA